MNEPGNTTADKNYKPSGIISEEYPEKVTVAYLQGYEQAEKDILSKFTKEHLEGLKWIERSGITSQPTPYHKYCKDLYKVLEELLKE